MKLGYFAISDVYGGVWGTTETTIPEEKDQQALVDDQNASFTTSDAGQKKVPMLACVAAIAAVAILLAVL